MDQQPQVTGDWKTPSQADEVGTRPAASSDTLDGKAAAPGLVFRNYELLGELGRGGMGVVYKARQKRADRLVALKVIHTHAGGDGRARARFLAEARALARASHPHIVTVYEVDEENDCPFFTMELIDGPSLSRRVREGPPLAPAESAQLIESLAGAVQAAHDVGVLHRDIKPANVLLGPDGKARLTDFGLAKHLDRDDGATVAGCALGTPSYMPPEQANGDLATIGPAADVYSLGATLYELLTGRPPFKGDSNAATILRVLKEDPVPPVRSALTCRPNSRQSA
jgi:serine/threonine protein kinase